MGGCEAADDDEDPTHDADGLPQNFAASAVSPGLPEAPLGGTVNVVVGHFFLCQLCVLAGG